MPTGARLKGDTIKLEVYFSIDWKKLLFHADETLVSSGRYFFSSCRNSCFNLSKRLFCPDKLSDSGLQSRKNIFSKLIKCMPASGTLCRKFQIIVPKLFRMSIFLLNLQPKLRDRVSCIKRKEIKLVYNNE